MATEPNLEGRRMRGEAIAQLSGQIRKGEGTNYRVHSQHGKA